MKTTYQTGLLGEQCAAEWLKKHRSMKLLETRYRNRAGEIDLIDVYDSHLTLEGIRLIAQKNAQPRQKRNAAKE